MERYSNRISFIFSYIEFHIISEFELSAKEGHAPSDQSEVADHQQDADDDKEHCS